MARKSTHILLLPLLICASTNLFAQKPTQNLAAWIGYELYLPFHEHGKWGILVESYMKGDKLIADLQGSFYRLGLNYYTPKGNRIGGGVAYQWNLPYDEVALPYENPDYRIYEQFVWRIEKKKRWSGPNASAWNNGGWAGKTKETKPNPDLTTTNSKTRSAIKSNGNGGSNHDGPQWLMMRYTSALQPSKTRKNFSIKTDCMWEEPTAWTRKEKYGWS